MNRLRIGVIGVGFGATVHVPAFLSEGWEVPVIWGRSANRTREVSERLGVPSPHEDWRELVARVDLDAVAITTPPTPHCEMALAALAAGKHVLCEKPFALNAVEANSMADAAHSSGRTAMVAHEFRHAPQRAHIRQLLDEGFVGKPRFASIELLIGRPVPTELPPITWGSSAAEGGGLLGALGSHYIDGLRHWFGDVREVSGRLSVSRPQRRDPSTERVITTDADDTFTFTLGFESGVFATMTATSAASPATGARIHLIGSDGVLQATQPGPNPEPDGIVLGGRGNVRQLEKLPMPVDLVPFNDDRDNRLMAFRLLVRDFEHSIRESRSLAPSFEDGAATQRVLDAIHESSATGGLAVL